MCLRLLAVVLLVVFGGDETAAQNSSTAAIDTYLQPYIQSGNFSGDVLVAKKGKVVFEKAYGFADREHRIRNTPGTRFHIASMSMQYTAAAVLRLIDARMIRLDDHVGDFVSGIKGADAITIRDLLTERSGLPDVNALPDYDDVLQHHQTPSSLIAKIEGKSLLFEPGTKFLHEEHSAYNLLALIVEKKSGLPFATAIKRLVFGPMGLTASGVDDDSITHTTEMAKGYEPQGTYGLKPAASIFWSGKTGNASAYATTSDEARFVHALFVGQGLSTRSRQLVLDTSMRVGYGWFKSENKRFGEVAYYMNGRAPGFASFVLYLPRAQTTVVVFSNIYSSATTPIGYDIAALSLGLPYERFQFDRNPSRAELASCAGKFQFGPDFYQPNAEISVLVEGKEISLRWPSGDLSPLIPLGHDHFLDRSYWEEVKVQRNTSGKPSVLMYDHFQGKFNEQH
jgi:D-alanyl-D-alanine carboxypeptidase